MSDVIRRRVLVVDDEPNIRRMLGGLLADEGFDVSSAGDLSSARELLARAAFDLVLMDVCLPGEDGLTVLRDPGERALLPPVIVMSGHGTIALAVEATRLGAYDFVEKPIAVERLLLSIRNCLHMERLSAQNAALQQMAGEGGEILGRSAAMARLREEIARAAPSEARVLISGESGTGKELVARALHAGSRRREGPLLKVNCAAIPLELLESELFGHEKGAFTGAVALRRGKFELAQGGALLLDEIGDMNAATQAKLLRVLEERCMERLGGSRTVQLDVRVLASTNQDLQRLLADGRFREDLYHRIKVVPIHVPPLREHIEDTDELAGFYLAHFCRANGRPAKRLTQGAIALLRAHDWPGNVRELKNLMERVVIMIPATTVEAEAMRELVGGPAHPARAEEPVPQDEDLAAGLLRFERERIQQALQASGGNIAEAARRLGLDRGNLHRKLQRLGIRR